MYKVMYKVYEIVIKVERHSSERTIALTCDETSLNEIFNFIYDLNEVFTSVEIIDINITNKEL